MFKNILVPIHLEYKKNHAKLLKGAFKLLDDEEGLISLLYVNENRAHSQINISLDDLVGKSNDDIVALNKLKEIAMEHSLPLDKISFNVKTGSVHQVVLDEATNIKADAIVMMSSKPGISSYFISTTAERVIRHSDCSVFVIRLDKNKEN